MENNSNTEQIKEDTNKLLVVWTSADRDVALKMVFMYVRNAKRNNWWNRVRFVVWGPSAKLLSEDLELQTHAVNMGEIGVELFACIACANMYGVTPALKALGFDVIPMGVPLTEMIKDDWKVLTF